MRTVKAFGGFAQFLKNRIIGDLCEGVIQDGLDFFIVVAGLGWGILLKGESYSTNVWLAASLMLAGVVFLTWSGRRNIVPDR